jgi:hypothetical protein
VSIWLVKSERVVERVAVHVAVVCAVGRGRRAREKREEARATPPPPPRAGRRRRASESVGPIKTAARALSQSLHSQEPTHTHARQLLVALHAERRSSDDPKRQNPRAALLPSSPSPLHTHTRRAHLSTMADSSSKGTFAVKVRLSESPGPVARDWEEAPERAGAYFVLRHKKERGFEPLFARPPRLLLNPPPPAGCPTSRICHARTTLALWLGLRAPWFDQADRPSPNRRAVPPPPPPPPIEVLAQRAARA